ncbi:MAG: hypothetical protein FD167_4 [bacterium]|nr:MAG: hypothetical protein FD167_4 [bacterium]
MEKMAENHVNDLAENKDVDSLLGTYVKIPVGEYMMGSNVRWASEQPVHNVKITKEFEIGATLITQAQWQAITGVNPSDFKGENRPVERVSWEDIQEFVEKVNKQSKHYQYRLPTEEEWEYAARAGTTEEYAGNLEEMAWYKANGDDQTHEVAQKKPNAWGLYDMHGNVWEWCEDWYEDYSTKMDPNLKGTSVVPCKAVRGGSWYFGEDYSRSAFRFYLTPDARCKHLGFRLVRNLCS